MDILTLLHIFKNLFLLFMYVSVYRIRFEAVTRKRPLNCP